MPALRQEDDEERRLPVDWMRGGRDLGLGGPPPSSEVPEGTYSSSSAESSVLSRAFEMVSAAALAVFRRGRGEVGACVVVGHDMAGFWICNGGG